LPSRTLLTCIEGKLAVSNDQSSRHSRSSADLQTFCPFQTDAGLKLFDYLIVSIGNSVDSHRLSSLRLLFRAFLLFSVQCNQSPQHSSPSRPRRDTTLRQNRNAMERPRAVDG
jgi:hypothetical protein